MVDDVAVEAFARDGVAVLRGLVTPAEVDLLRSGIGKVVAGPSHRSVVASSADDPGRFVEDFLRWVDVPEIETVALLSAIPEAAAGLLDTNSVRFFHDHVLVKSAGTEQRTPWHQDQPYYNVDGPAIGAWVPVDPVPKAGSPEFWAGSHLGPMLLPRTFLDREAKWFPEGSLGEVPDIEADPSAYDIRQWQLAPGDVVFFHSRTVHSAPGFPFEHDRRAVNFRYLAAEARHAPRPWATSPEFPNLAEQLPEGAPFDHPYFPMAWPRTKSPS
jgi:ectoine hydroxylase-related dioxygenase (phytanoyl-CoA dioxygenase family)